MNSQCVSYWLFFDSFQIIILSLNLSNCVLLMKDNFILQPSVDVGHSATESYHIDNYDAGTVVNVKFLKSYDASTGTISCSLNASGGNYFNCSYAGCRPSEPENGAVVSYGCKVYLVK